jgi:hypothetical protein
MKKLHEKIFLEWDFLKKDKSKKAEERYLKVKERKMKKFEENDIQFAMALLSLCATYEILGEY